MSLALRKSAFSPNIKERRDCSCAIFDTSGRLVAQSKDIPVHLGAMPMSVKSCISEMEDELVQGTMALVNDPFSGGSHLPDLTLVAPFFFEGKRAGFVGNRAHHADIGGESPGSMPGMSSTIHDEGVLIRPRLVVSNNIFDKGSISDLLTATRTPEERMGDLSAQMAANLVGVQRVLEVAETHGQEILLANFVDLQNYSAKMMSTALREHDRCSAKFIDFMDSDGAGNWRIPISVSVEIADGRVSVNFDGTSGQVDGNINCPIASTTSAVYFAFISLFGKNIPTNEGCWRVIDIDVPKGSFLNPEYPAAVSAGNVETTQRIVDVLLGALSEIVPEKIPAASQGTMNNLAIGGIDLRTGERFSFYETIGGGSGARRGQHGTSAIHVHMTNTLNTPIEALENAYPLRVWEYSIRPSSGGSGQWNGGEGIVREIEVLGDDCVVSIQSERRHSSPWGLHGGHPAKMGKNIIKYLDKKILAQAKSTIAVPAGTVVRLETPGGGGHSQPPKSRHKNYD